MKDDLISRSALKNAFKAWKTMDDYYHDTDCNDIPLSEAFDLIDNAPIVAYPERLINEYISKVGCCDECFASVYCTVNGLRKSRVPQDYCVKNIKRYFGDKANLSGSEDQKGGTE